MMNWDGITHIFQIPLDWFREVSRRTNIIGDGRFIEVERNNPDGTVLRINADEIAGAVSGDEYVTIGTAQSITGAKTFTSRVVTEMPSGVAQLGSAGVWLYRGTNAPAVRYYEAGATSSSAVVQLNDSGVLEVRSWGAGQGVSLVAAANTATLGNAPTVGQADTTSKAIATCGWCNTQLAQVDHTHEDAYAAKTHSHGNISSDGKLLTSSNKFVITDANGNIKSSDGYLTPAEVSAIQNCALFVTDSNAPSGRDIKNLNLCENWLNREKNGLFLRGGNSASIEMYPTGNNGGYIDFHLDGSTADYTSRIYEGTVSGTSGLHIIGGSAVVLNAPENEAKLANAPTVSAADATDSKAIATCGWTDANYMRKSQLEANKLMVTDDDGSPSTFVEDVISDTKTVITGVTWNGTQIVVASESWKFVSGILTKITANASTTIDTVTYNP